MSDEPDEPGLRQQLLARLLSEESRLPTSALGRLGRTGWAVLRGRGVRDADPGDVDDVEEIVRLVTSAGQLKGVAMKAAQVLSYTDLALPEPVREGLSVLQTHAQPMSFETVAGILEAELGERAEPLLEEMDRVPVAAASIGQVHRSRLPEGPDVGVKVQYPRIQEAIANDVLAARIGPRVASLLFPRAAPVEAVIDEARRRLSEECDYEREARMQTRLATIYDDHPVIEIPDIHDLYSTGRVLTSTFVDAPGFDAFLRTDPDQATRDRLGEALFTFYVGTLFRHGLFNADPHPGNYLVPAEDRLVLLDHGCVLSFEPAFVDDLARLSRAAREGEPAELDEALVALGIAEADDEEALATGRRFVEAFYAPFATDGEGRVDVDEQRALADVMAAKRELMRLSLPGSFLFLLRIRFGLASVLARLDAKADWYTLEADHVAGRR